MLSWESMPAERRWSTGNNRSMSANGAFQLVTVPGIYEVGTFPASTLAQNLHISSHKGPLKRDLA